MKGSDCSDTGKARGKDCSGKRGRGKNSSRGNGSDATLESLDMATEQERRKQQELHDAKHRLADGVTSKAEEMRLVILAQSRSERDRLAEGMLFLSGAERIAADEALARYDELLSELSVQCTSLVGLGERLRPDS